MPPPTHADLTAPAERGTTLLEVNAYTSSAANNVMHTHLVMKLVFMWQALWYSDHVVYIFAFTALVRALGDVADFIKADFKDVVPVLNATCAVNAVVSSLKLKQGDLLLMTNATYPAVSAGMHAVMGHQMTCSCIQLQPAQPSVGLPQPHHLCTWCLS